MQRARDIGGAREPTSHALKSAYLMTNMSANDGL